MGLLPGWVLELISRGEKNMEKYFDYLDNLRKSGVTNMFGAVPYLQQEFPELSYDRAQAVYILREWMASHSGNGGNEEC